MNPGDVVQTPFGRGTLREIRNNGRVLVDVRGRSMVFDQAEIAPADERRRRNEMPAPAATRSEAEPHRSGKVVHVPAEIDLHGLTVEQALARAETALNDGLLANLVEVRFIHGRSAGRIRDALHRWLAGIEAVRAFRLEPHNPGVTIVQL